MGFSKLSTVICTSMLLLTACGGTRNTAKSTVTLPGNWQATPIAVDGDSKDWPSPYPNYDSKSKVAYATANDRKFIYITMQSGDELTQMKILKAGMTVSIDTGGKKNTEFNINYPLENGNAELDIPAAPDGQKESAVQFQKQMAQRIRKAMESANQFTLEGFSGCTGGYMVNQTIPCGVKVKARIDEYKELVWEAAIPVKVLYGKDELTAADAARPISVCFSIKGSKAPKAAGSNNANGGMNQNMGGGGGRNAAMGGMAQGSGRGANPMDHLYLSTKTWKQFSLVVQP